MNKATEEPVWVLPVVESVVMRGSNPHLSKRDDILSCLLSQSEFAWIAIEVQILTPN